MKILFHKFLVILISLNILLVSCGTSPVEFVNWNTPGPITEMEDVSPFQYLDENQLSYPTPGIRPLPSQPPQIAASNQSTFCDGNPQHECYGDKQGGWRDIYNTSGELWYVEYSVLGNPMAIQYSNGEYYLSCSGKGGDQQKVKEGFVKNLQEKIRTLNGKRDAYEKASQDAGSGIGWAIGGGVVTCVGGILIAGFTGGWGWPAVVAGCGYSGAAGIVGGGMVAAGVGNAQTSRAERELNTAKNDLTDFVKTTCP